jgi:poly(hydroxyalkanoate) granule-associated protein
MSTKAFPFSFDFQTTGEIPAQDKDSAQKIWLAGLGAFAKAQAEGGKAFQKLVEDGMAMQQHNQQAAQKKLTEATEKMTAMAGSWGKLEGIFEDRVARALRQLGTPTQDDLQALRDEVAQLRAQLKASAKKAPAATKARAGK